MHRVLGAVVLVACSTQLPTPDDAVAPDFSVACAQSLAAYCAAPYARCSLDAGALRASCASSVGSSSFYSPSPCGGYFVFGSVSGEEHTTLAYYDAVTMQLVALTGADGSNSPACLAGPASFAPPSSCATVPCGH